MFTENVTKAVETVIVTTRQLFKVNVVMKVGINVIDYLLPFNLCVLGFRGVLLCGDYNCMGELTFNYYVLENFLTKKEFRSFCNIVSNFASGSS